MQDEKLKEFVEKYSFHCGVGCEASTEHDIIPFAQAVAAFTEKRVLEELRDFILRNATDEKCGLLNQVFAKISDNLAALGKEKDGEESTSK